MRLCHLPCLSVNNVRTCASWYGLVLFLRSWQKCPIDLIKYSFSLFYHDYQGQTLINQSERLNGRDKSKYICGKLCGKTLSTKPGSRPGLVLQR